MKRNLVILAIAFFSIFARASDRVLDCTAANQRVVITPLGRDEATFDVTYFGKVLPPLTMKIYPAGANRVWYKGDSGWDIAQLDLSTLEGKFQLRASGIFVIHMTCRPQ